MGTYLSKPVLDKHTDSDVVLECPTTPLAWACIDMQGWRKTMEDAHIANTDVSPPEKIEYKLRHDALSSNSTSNAQGDQTEKSNLLEEIEVNPSGTAKVFAVFDGHGGSEVAKFCDRYLVEVLVKQTKWQEGDVCGALIDSFHELDRMIDHPSRKDELIQLKLDQMHIGTGNANNIDNSESPQPPTQNLANAPPLSTARTTISEIIKTPFHQRRGKKDKDPNNTQQQNNKSAVNLQSQLPEQQASKLIDTTEEVEGTEGITSTNEADSKTKTQGTDEDENSELTSKAEVALEKSNEEPSSLSAHENGKSSTLHKDEEIEDRDSRENGELAEDPSSTDSDAIVTSNKDDNVVDDPEMNSLPSGHTDAKLLIQKLLEISESVDKLESEKRLLAAMGARTLSVVGSEEDKKDPPRGNANSSMRPTDTPSRVLNGRQICNLPDHPIHAGCTSIVAVLIEKVLTVANAGDSRAVLCRKGGIPEALSIDHKPMQPREMSRITKAGGFINHFGRVNGNLNLSRSIGDLKYKQTAGLPPSEQMITAQPDITQIKLEEGDEFIVMGCDGIWDCLSNEAALKYVRERIGTKSPKEIGEEMLDDIVSVDPKATQGIGGDNMTVLIIDLLPHTRSYITEKKNDDEEVKLE